MGLNICVFCTEKLTGTLACDFLNNVYTLTAAVVTLAGITLGILICKVASHSRHNGRRNEVFACNKLKISALSFKLVGHSLSYLGIVAVEILKRCDVC